MHYLWPFFCIGCIFSVETSSFGSERVRQAVDIRTLRDKLMYYFE